MWLFEWRQICNAYSSNWSYEGGIGAKKKKKPIYFCFLSIDLFLMLWSWNILDFCFRVKKIMIKNISNFKMSTVWLGDEGKYSLCHSPTRVYSRACWNCSLCAYVILSLLWVPKIKYFPPAHPLLHKNSSMINQGPKTNQVQKQSSSTSMEIIQTQ